MFIIYIHFNIHLCIYFSNLLIKQVINNLPIFVFVCFCFWFFFCFNNNFPIFFLYYYYLLLLLLTITFGILDVDWIITAFYRIGQCIVVCINFVIPDSVGPIFSTCTVLRNNNNNNKIYDWLALLIFWAGRETFYNVCREQRTLFAVRIAKCTIYLHGSRRVDSLMHD